MNNDTIFKKLVISLMVKRRKVMIMIINHP